MVICRYFLQNRCSFGDRCRYEHTCNFDDLNVNQRAEFIHSNLMEWRNSRMWLLSKYVPFENYSEFGNFTNMLFEEDRFNFYSARENNTLPQYVANIKELRNKMASKINVFINNSTNIYNELRNIIRIDNINNQIAKPVENKTFAFITQSQQSLPSQSQQQVFHNNITFGNGFQQTINSEPQNKKELVTPMESDSKMNNNNITSTTFTEVVSCLYSQLENLSDWEIEAYKADHFEFGKIPIKPPTFNLC